MIFISRIISSTVIKTPNEKLRLVPIIGLEANRKKCMDSTRVEILETISSWTHETSHTNIFLLIGGAGAGKLIITKAIAQGRMDEERLGSYIYFMR